MKDDEKGDKEEGRILANALIDQQMTTWYALQKKAVVLCEVTYLPPIQAQQRKIPRKWLTDKHVSLTRKKETERQIPKRIYIPKQ